MVLHVCLRPFALRRPVGGRGVRIEPAHHRSVKPAVDLRDFRAYRAVYEGLRPGRGIEGVLGDLPCGFRIHGCIIGDLLRCGRYGLKNNQPLRVVRALERGYVPCRGNTLRADYEVESRPVIRVGRTVCFPKGGLVRKVVSRHLPLYLPIVGLDGSHLVLEGYLLNGRNHIVGRPGLHF